MRASSHSPKSESGMPKPILRAGVQRKRSQQSSRRMTTGSTSSSMTEPHRARRRLFGLHHAAKAVSFGCSSASAGGMLPIGSRRRRLLNRSTHSRGANRYVDLPPSLFHRLHLRPVRNHVGDLPTPPGRVNRQSRALAQSVWLRPLHPKPPHCRWRRSRARLCVGWWTGWVVVAPETGGDHSARTNSGGLFQNTGSVGVLRQLHCARGHHGLGPVPDP